MQIGINKPLHESEGHRRIVLLERIYKWYKMMYALLNIVSVLLEYIDQCATTCL